MGLVNEPQARYDLLRFVTQMYLCRMNKDLTPADFTYELPVEAIAFHPSERRDGARLLHFKRGTISDRLFGEVPAILPLGSQLVLNNTRVIHARLHAYKSSGGKLEIFLLRPASGSVETAMAARSNCSWICLVGGAKKWKTGPVELGDGDLSVSAEKGVKNDDEYVIHFNWSPEEKSFSEVVETLGKIPLPPYIAREAVDDDRIRYQTAFAERPGSVAAPTAGLHFTDELLSNLNSDLVKLTLHVSAGTFKPMGEGSIADHHMHEEQCEVSLESIRDLAKPVKRFAVGTTALRTLESLYWLAVKWQQTGSQARTVDQYEPYQLDTPFHTYEAAMTWLASKMESSKQTSYTFTTSIMIAPGYQVRAVDGLFTNFHMPKSTLLLLVSACIGDAWKTVYEHALTSGYRFLSYGDSSLLEFER